MLLLKHVALILLLLRAFVVSAEHSTDTDTTAQNERQANLALNLALSDLKRRRQSQPDASRLAYIEEQRDDAGSRLVRQYIPPVSEHQAGTWLVVEQSGDSSDSNPLQWDVDMMPGADSMSVDNLNYKSSTPSHWVFTMKNGVSATTSAQDIDVDSAATSANLITELHVSKHSNTITSMHIENANPFKPTALTTVNTFKVDIFFEPMFTGGPLVVKKVNRVLDARYGFFFSVSENVRLHFSQFHFVESGVASGERS